MTAILEGQDRLAAFRVPDDAKHTVKVPDETGYTIFDWTVGDDVKVEEARQAFNTAVDQRHVPFRMENAVHGEKMEEKVFDETLGQIEFARHTAGG